MGFCSFTDLCSSDGSKAALAAQQLQGALFVFMGGACLFFPVPVMEMSIIKPPPEPISAIIFQCFGSQACLAGLLLLTSKLDQRGFYLWAVAMVPYVIFDWVAYSRGYVTTFGALGDLAGNIIFITLSLFAVKKLQGQHHKPN